MASNDKQVGGNHYGGGEYQHWDWVHDCRMSYHAGVASKYVDRWRWRSKNGAQDLEKAQHYLEKCEELKLTGSIQTHRAADFWRYVSGREHTIVDACILWYIMEGEWAAAQEAITVLIEGATQPS